MRQRIRSFHAFFFSALLASCASGMQERPPIAVMTFNIRYGTANDGENSWPNRSGLVIDVLREHAPGIVGVQEALRFQLDELRDALPRYAELGVGRDDGLESGEYTAILFDSSGFAVKESGTFWLSDTPDVPGSKTWGNRITRICTWARFSRLETGETFHIYNLHLDHESQPSRERSAELLVRRIATRGTSGPVIVLGDFNAGEDNPAIRFLTGTSDQSQPNVRLRDTYRVLHPSPADVGTFNAFRGETSGDQIDWILVSHEWEVVEATIVRTNDGGRYPSDHFPVTASVRLRE